VTEFYDDMQGLASTILSEFSQGDIVYVAPSAASGDPWNPSLVSGARTTVKGVGRGVQQKYVDGTHVVATDQQFTIQAGTVTPVSGATIEVDGSILQIIKVIKVPAAGTAVVWMVFARS
jgi:hypothetical protein